MWIIIARGLIPLNPEDESGESMMKIRLKAIFLAVGMMLGICGGVSAAAEEDVKLSDDSSDFVLISDAVPDAILEIRY